MLQCQILLDRGKVKNWTAEFLFPRFIACNFKYHNESLKLSRRPEMR